MKEAHIHALANLKRINIMIVNEDPSRGRVVFTPYMPGWKAPCMLMRRDVLSLAPFEGWVFIHHDRHAGHFSAIVREAASAKKRKRNGKGDVSRANAIEISDSD